MAKLTPVQQTAIKWWNKLPQGERTNLIHKYGAGLENLTTAYTNESSRFKDSRADLDDLLGSKP